MKARKAINAVCAKILGPEVTDAFKTSKSVTWDSPEIWKLAVVHWFTDQAQSEVTDSDLNVLRWGLKRVFYDGCLSCEEELPAEFSV